MKGIFSFTAGLLVGSAVTYFAVKHVIEKRANDEIEEVREIYRTMKHQDETKNKSTEELKESKDDVKNKVTKDDVKEYDEISSQYKSSNKVNYSDISTKEKMKPYIIRPEEFDEMEDYDTLSFMYYHIDDILADENDDVVENVEDIVGLDFAEHFGEFEDDSVYVRNDKYKIDYEILLSDRSYLEDHPSYKPHEVEE